MFTIISHKLLNRWLKYKWEAASGMSRFSSTTSTVSPRIVVIPDYEKDAIVEYMERGEVC